MNHHFVQHFLRPGDYVRTEFTCTAPWGSKCRVACWTCYAEQHEDCRCEYLDVPRKPNMTDFGYCLQTIWLTEDAPEECYNGEEQPVRGPEPQAITLVWDGDDYSWDYA